MAMNKTPLEIILSVSPFGFRLLDEPKHRYISEIWAAPGCYEIHGKAGMKRYMGYTKREAMKLYNALCR